MSTHAYAPRHRAAEPTLRRPLIAALAVLVAMFAASVSAGWRLADDAATGQVVADLTGLIPSTGTFKTFVIAVVAYAFIRRNA